MRIHNSEVPLRRFALAKFSPLYTRLRDPDLFRSVGTFCMFIGHGRSGSSLVGALLNAHPNTVMSNELDVISYLEAGLGRSNIFNLIYYMSRRQVERGSRGGGGYSYAVPNQWQGSHREVQVIGDRKAGGTAIQIYRNPDLVSLIQSKIGIPVRFVHVVRNPFDALATTVRKTVRLAGESEESHLRRQIAHYFERMSAVNTVRKGNGEDTVHVVYHENLIASPKDELKRLCRFLNLNLDDQYLNDCASIIRKEPHITRNQISWNPALINEIETKMNQYRWLECYQGNVGG